MKHRGQHREKALTPIAIKAFRAAGRYGDGSGLYLVVDPSGAKRWVLRTVVQGRRRDIGLGSANVVSLAEARELASRYRKIAKDGGDPISVRRQERLVVPTFEDAARRVHEEHKSTWTNLKHRAQWLSSLEEYAFPHVGTCRVDALTTSDVQRALLPIWTAKPETARRVRQRIGMVLDWAKASGFRTGDNPIGGVTKGLPKQVAKVNHHKALPFSEVPQFIRDLRSSDCEELTKLAFEFMILTAARTSEVLNATWLEVDLSKGVWTIPAERMKGRREHRIPLSPQALGILASAKKVATGGGYIFSGRKFDTPLSNMAFLMCVRRMDIDVTPHGFRSTFRDWAAEKTNFPSDVCEMALAHAVRDKTEAAYRRGDLFEKRRQLMKSWSDFVTKPIATVVALDSRRKSVGA